MLTDRLFRSYPDVVTVEELCEMLHIGRNPADSLQKSGGLRSERIGKKYVVSTVWVAEFLKEQRAELI